MDIQGTCRMRLGNLTVIGTGSNVQCRHTKELTAYPPLDWHVQLIELSGTLVVKHGVWRIAYTDIDNEPTMN